MTKERPVSLNGDVPRYYNAVHSSKVPPRKSAYQRLLAGKVGIRNCNCIRVDRNGIIWLKEFPCFCNWCFDCDFSDDCPESEKHGKWLKVNKLKKKAEIKKRKRVIYDTEDPDLIKLFDGQDANKWIVKDLKKLCKTKEIIVEKGWIKNDLIRSLIIKEKGVLIPVSGFKEPVTKKRRLNNQ